MVMVVTDTVKLKWLLDRVERNIHGWESGRGQGKVTLRKREVIGNKIFSECMSCV